MSESGEDARLRLYLEVSKAFDTAEDRERVAAIFQQEQERIMARIESGTKCPDLPYGMSAIAAYDRAIADCIAAIDNDNAPGAIPVEAIDESALELAAPEIRAQERERIAARIERHKWLTFTGELSEWRKVHNRAIDEALATIRSEGER